MPGEVFVVELASQSRASQGQPGAAVPHAPVARGEAFLATDVGGTHARVALMAATPGCNQPASVLHYRRYLCAEWPSLGALLRDFLAGLPGAGHGQSRLRHGVIATAGMLVDGAIVNENLPWPVAVDALRDELGFARLEVINDFQAVAWAVQFLGAEDTLPVIDAVGPSTRGPALVMGPGTGLGSAVLLPRAGHAEVLATEAGQISLAPGNEREMDILRILARGRTHVTVEDAISGPGLLNLHRALCELRAVPATLPTPAAITAAALAGHDAAAGETLEVFCGLLGSFAGDLALLYGASGGVFLAGGILPQIHAHLRASRFAERFLDKGAMRTFLQKIPVRLIAHGQLGVIGAAGWLLDEQRGKGAALLS